MLIPNGHHMWMMKLDEACLFGNERERVTTVPMATAQTSRQADGCCADVADMDGRVSNVHRD